MVTDIDIFIEFFSLFLFQAKAKAADLPPGKFTYTTKDAILYALGGK